MKRERSPTEEELQKLIDWLAPAGRDYVTEHARLAKMFSVRGCVDEWELADEVLNRVATRIDKLRETYQGDPIKCLIGFKDYVYKEYLRDPKWDRPADPDRPARLPARPNPESISEVKEWKFECLEECLAELSEADRTLICRYFEEDKLQKLGRRTLAEELELTANALRIRAHRLRGRMRECMDLCLAKKQEA
jgi:RNA polymerase sigma factor (sigma-70 family)